MQTRSATTLKKEIDIVRNCCKLPRVMVQGDVGAYNCGILKSPFVQRQVYVPTRGCISCGSDADKTSQRCNASSKILLLNLKYLCATFAVKVPKVGETV